MIIKYLVEEIIHLNQSSKMFKFFSKALQGKVKRLFSEEMISEEDISWYHGNLTREEAEEVLKKASLSGGDIPNYGLFLVRDSTTTQGDFVLSVLDQSGEILNYQIRRHGEDAFFSIDESRTFHGLETLIEYYKNEEELCVQPVPGQPPPPNTRSHGRNNLLHRATSQGDFKVVSELVRCGYRNIEAKNEDGQTAVHVASKLRQESILDTLIQAGASVNCRDTFGNTPLHYACQNNSINMVRLLLLGGANVQLRNNSTGWVPLHEAASRGHKEIVEHLLRVGAPARPRTTAKKTPQQLAEENGFYTISNIIKTHEGPKPKTTEEDWYHGTLSRDEASTLLRQTKANTDGRFLVRYSEPNGLNVLTMMYMDQVYNYVISKQGSFYVIDDGPLLDSLPHVIEHYSTMADGLPTILQTPVKPKPKPPVPLFGTMPTRGRKGPRWSEGNATTLPLPPKGRRTSEGNTLKPSRRERDLNLDGPEVMIPRDSLILKEVIGEGEFGSVFRAFYQRRDGSEIKVAVKTLHPDNAASRDSFLKEAQMMMMLDHHCIVNFIGISGDDSSPLMVQELVPLGSMLSFIIQNPDQVSPEYELHVWASQIACGMKYLESHRVVHRDLAARNILLATRHQAKVSDFGLSRPLNDRDYYQATAGGRWPIKWYAPESYNFGTFSSASDVWSFGVTLWEMFSYGEQPYGEKRGTEVIELLEKGERLGCPVRCPSDVYKMMLKCWEKDKADRPNFDELLSFFASRTNYENVCQLVSELDIS